ncbi:tRNA (cytosine(38)-C(5))-methyltransferase-like [Lineus longissimus]|uniref:tRNA (cytosine(38)-C(5))-methyltransferase-like n=1 Tax=Lineus longissimus TaxID=88925 RepID=UPI002B4F2D3B
MANITPENLVKLRVLELFSGIGGWHCGLEESQVPHDVIAAADVNTTANEIYTLNFSATRIINKAIQALSVEDFEKFNADMIVMSPPCQPFTRVGLQRDTEDIRTKPFLHILKVLESLQNLPNYLLLENVKGFEVSQARELLVNTMEKCGYDHQEFLLSPLQFGIPNARLRYYFLAKRKPLSFSFTAKDEVWEELPECAKIFMRHQVDCESRSCQSDAINSEESVTMVTSGVEDVGWMGRCNRCSETDSDIQFNQNFSAAACGNVSLADGEKVPPDACDEVPSAQKEGVNNDSYGKEFTSQGICDKYENSLDLSDDELLAHEMVERELSKYTKHCRTLQYYLEQKDEAYFDEYLVPEEKLKRMAVMDLVKPTERKCICFTKAYGHHMNGTGSMLQQGPDPTSDVHLKKKDFSDSEWLLVRQLKLRFFTPREIAKIMCFPSDYKFPKHFTKRQCYRVLGNSLNVHVCSTLIKLLVLPEIPS